MSPGLEFPELWDMTVCWEPGHLPLPRAQVEGTVSSYFGESKTAADRQQGLLRKCQVFLKTGIQFCRART